ncbi:MAG: ORC1-type DNA replication protein [Methanocalculus sp. MSAO_Arc2]|uniref:ORC1-type DNA replication protein n=1 Tax=Methanocalculus sp. MSAO_Arc2 TaxID=2293855 RepID=UPI000FEE2F46|nr:MAG: ORC1-type DNA replication protein [Methanocalculus sp. MSAO_Arc2]
MVRRLLMWDETLFRDPLVFEVDYIPDTFRFREEQIAELSFQIQPALRGSRPMHSLCRGPPGTGKTTTIKKLFDEIEETTKKIACVHINCKIDNTKYAIMAKIFKRLIGHLPLPSGTSFKQVYDAIFRHILKEDQILIVCLDDANYLIYEKEINNLLYPLLRAHEEYEHVRVGIILIFSDMDLDPAAAFDGRVASVLNHAEIFFPPYTAAEVEEILRMRIIQGFYPHVVPDEMLALVVDRTMRTGDLRVGIDLLKRAGLLAERDARTSVSQDDVCRAYQVSERYHIASLIRTLRDDERYVLRVIALMSREDSGMTAGEVHTRVKEETGIMYTRYYEIVQKLDLIRLINLDYRPGRGRTRVISLRYSPEKICAEVGSAETI